MAETLRRPEEAVYQKNEPKVSQDEDDLPKASASLPQNRRRSADHSPLHPQYQAKLGLAPLTPLRSRMKSTPRGNETPEKGASVPEFGAWADDPSSADGYTQIFNQVREERQGGAGSTPSMAAGNGSLFKNNSSKGCCCFPWGGN